MWSKSLLDEIMDHDVEGKNTFILCNKLGAGFVIQSVCAWNGMRESM